MNRFSSLTRFLLGQLVGQTSSTGLGSAEILLKRVEDLVHRRPLTALGRGETLLYGLNGLQPFGKIEKSLVGRRVMRSHLVRQATALISRRFTIYAAVRHSECMLCRQSIIMDHI